MSLIYGAVSLGSDSPLVEVECSLNNGLPGTQIVGLGGKLVDESRERIRSSFSASKLQYPRKKVLVNLAPASLPKNESSLELAIAIAIINVSSPAQLVEEKSLFLGELSLSGDIRPVRGAIGKLLSARSEGIPVAYVPIENVEEAKMVKGLQVFAVKNLLEVIKHLSGRQKMSPERYIEKLTSDEPQILLADIRGHKEAKRALAVAVAGGHNIHLYGPPGSGKSSLARTVTALLPPLSRDEALVATHLHSLLGVDRTTCITSPPFRSPHHTSSEVSIVGGGKYARPGEIALANNGVLFLDELPEYPRKTIESLRQPLEDGLVTISRSEVTASYPCRFMLVATSNPCPCGYLDSPKPCKCSPSDINKYKKKLSGPIIDRIDMHLHVPNIETKEMLEQDVHDPEAELSILLRDIKTARERQKNRNPEGVLNRDLSLGQMKKLGMLNVQVNNSTDRLAKHLGLTNRGVVRLLRLARTIADMDNEDSIQEAHLLECAQYRQRAT